MAKRADRKTGDTGDRVLLVGVTGTSGAGKSTVAEALVKALGREKAVLLRQDDYYRDLGHLKIEDRVKRNFDDPASVELELLEEHLEALKRGEAVECPVYDFTAHTRVRGKSKPVEPRPVVVVEGIFLGWAPGIRRLLDLLVYVDAPEEVRLARRIQRDRAHRGRTEESVKRQWREQVAPAGRAFVEPAKKDADLVLDGTAGVQACLESLLHRVESLLGG